MAQPDSTQYFQFDSQGNMFIYAPGAGCTGKTKLVKPGDELIFCSTYEWDQREGPTMSAEEPLMEEGLAWTCPAELSSFHHEFKQPLPATSLMELSHKNFSPETLKKIRWVRKMYKDWQSYRHSLGFEYIKCDLEDKATISTESLLFALCRFITEIKKVNGEDFPGKTLYDIVVCVQFHLETLGYSYKLINEEAFRDLKFTLDNTMKHRTVAAIGTIMRQAEVLTATMRIIFGGSDTWAR